MSMFGESPCIGVPSTTVQSDNEYELVKINFGHRVKRNVKHSFNLSILFSRLKFFGSKKFECDIV